MLDVTYLSSRADDVMNELLEQQRYTDVAHHARPSSSSSCSPLELSLNQKINEGVCIHFWQQITVTKVRNTQGSHCQHLDNIREAEACLIVEVIAIIDTVIVYLFRRASCCLCFNVGPFFLFPFLFLRDRQQRNRCNRITCTVEKPYVVLCCPGDTIDLR